MIKLVHSRAHTVPSKAKKPKLTLIQGGQAPAPQPTAAENEPLISEFYVHAVLQAARAEKMGLDEDSAKSWGMNRAIFYEAAKKGYIQRGRKRAAGTRFKKGTSHKKRPNFGQLYSLGKERAFAVQTQDGGVRFVIGGQVQTPEVFDKRIKKRYPNWELVWTEAMKLMEEAGLPVLKSPSRFHSQIYKAWRDSMTRRWPRGQKALEAASAVA
jgi:hypothetical protein